MYIITDTKDTEKMSQRVVKLSTVLPDYQFGPFHGYIYQKMDKKSNIVLCQNYKEQR